MTTTATNVTATATRTSVTGSLLTVHLFLGTSHFGAGLCFVRSLTSACLVHHNNIMQQLLVDGCRNILRANLVLTDFFAGGIVNWQTRHDQT